MDRDATLDRLRRETDATLFRERQRLVRDEVARPQGEEILFLGTGGNPTNVAFQHRQTGGFIVTAEGFSLYADPGPGAIYHAARAGAELRNLGAVFISHQHTDHAQGAGAIIEAMCRGMTASRGLLLAPEEVLSGLSPYYRGVARSRWYPGGPEGSRGLVAGTSVSLQEGLTLTATPTHHAESNVGFRLEGQSVSLGYTSDTAYIVSYEAGGGVREVQPGVSFPEDFQAAVKVHDDVTDAFRGVGILILNVSFFHQNPHRHLTAYGAVELLKRVKPNLGILTHFDPSLGTPPERAQDLAGLVSDLTGVPVRAAHDGLRIGLDQGRRP